MRRKDLATPFQVPDQQPQLTVTEHTGKSVRIGSKYFSHVLEFWGDAVTFARGEEHEFRVRKDVALKIATAIFKEFG